VVLVVTHPASTHAYEKIWSDSVADLEPPTTSRCCSATARRLLIPLKEADPDIIVANNWRTCCRRVFNLPATAR